MAAYVWEFQAKGGASVNAISKSLERLNVVATSFLQTAKTIETGLDRIGKAFDASAEKARNMASALKEVVAVRAELGLKSTAAAANTVEKAIGNVSIKIDNSSRVMNSHKEIVNNVSKTYNKYVEGVKQAEQAAKPAASASSLFGQAMQAAATSGGGLSGALTAGLSVIPGWGQAIQIASQALGRLASAAKNAYDAILKAGIPVDLMKGQLKALLSPTDLANGKFEEMIANAKELSLLPGIEQSDVLSGFIALSKAGNNATDAMAKMPAALRLAQAESRSIESAAKDVSVAWNIFGDSLRGAGKDFSYTAAILSAGSLSSPINDVAELTRGIRQSGGVMKTYNLGLEDNIALMGMLAQRSYNGAQAGNALKSVLTRMASDTPAVKKAYDELGISITDGQGKFKEFPVILDELRVALSSVSDEARSKLQAAIAGKNYLPQFQALVEMGGGAFRKLREDIVNNLGSLENQQKAKINSMQGAIELFRSNWENVKVTFSEIIRTPVIAFWSSFGDAIGNVGGRLDKLTADFLKMVAQFEGEGKNPLDAWIAALQKFDWSSIWNEFADTAKPVIDVVLKLSYNAASAFQNFIVRSTPKVIIQLGKFAVQTLLSMIKKAFFYAVRLARNAVMNVVDSIKGAFRFVTGGKPPEASKAAQEESPSIKTEYDTSELEEAVELETEITEIKKKERDISAELTESAEKRKKAAEDEQVARAAILQQMNATLSTEQAMQLAGTDEGKAKAERFQANAKKQEENAAIDRARALDIQGSQKVGFQSALKQATVERQGMERLKEEQKMLELAKGYLSVQKEIAENKKKQAETAAQLANIPIEQQMTKNTQDTKFSQWLLEPINKFQEAISGVIGKFMGVFENLGNKRVEARQKSGRLDEAGAKQESVAVLEGSVTRAEKMLKLAQTPGQKAEALQTQAEKLLEISDLTGDKSKAAQADELLKRAQAEQGKQEDIEIEKIGLDRKLAQDNVKLLANKRDGSASEGVARLQQLMESYQNLGDVKGASDAKRQLEAMQRQAAGESVTVLKQILQELQLSRKGSDLQMKEQNGILKQTADKTAQAVSQSANAMPMFDPGMAAPAF